MNFGKYAIANEVTHQFEQEPQWWWKINPVTTGDELDMSRYLNHNRIVVTPEGRKEQPPTHMEIATREVAMTFGGTNIPKEYDKPVDEGGEPFIKVGASIDEIERAIALMPHEMFLEIWKAVGQAYPYWGPADPNPVQKQS